MAPLLGTAGAAISDVINTPRTSSDTFADGTEMAATFDAILERQREHIAKATLAQLAAAARTYAAAAARR